MPQTGEGYTIYGKIIGVTGQGAGPALRPDVQDRQQGEAIMQAGPYVVVAARILEEHDWCLHHPNIKGIAAQLGGATSHGAVVAREEKIPCVVDAPGVSEIQPGDQVRVDGSTGEIQVNGGGAGLAASGSGEPVLNFAWVDHSRMSREADKQTIEEMVQYLDSFGLWNNGGVSGTAYDNGYAQVSQQPPQDQAHEFEIWLKSRYPQLSNFGTEPPPAAHEHAAPGVGGEGQPGAGGGQPMPQMAATDLYRFIWSHGYHDYRQLDPSDPNKAGTLHGDMIMEAMGSDHWTWDSDSVAGIIYDNGDADVFLSGPDKPHDADQLEQWLRSSFPEVKQVNFKEGGGLSMMGSIKSAALQPGEWYSMHSPEYTVPDVVHVHEVNDEGITASIEGDDKGLFPIHLKHEEIQQEGYRFEPYAPSVGSRAGNYFIETQETSSIREARRNFTHTEQKELVNENMSGRARNLHKLNLDGTHYQAIDEDTSVEDILSGKATFFLW